MSHFTREVILGQVWTLLVDGPCSVYMRCDDGDMTIAEMFMESGRGYPIKSGSEHHFQLNDGESLYGMATMDDTPTVVNMLISTTT